MADNDKDRTTLAPGQASRPGLSGSASPGATQPGSEPGIGGQGAGAAPRSGTSSSDMGAKGKQAAEEAKHYAGDMADRAKEQGNKMFEERKHSTANQVDSVAHAFRSAADQLKDDEQSQAGRYVNMAADRLESFGQQLRQKDMDSLLADVESLGRRAPGTFFAGSVVAGLLLARFLKSSSERRHASSTEVQRSRSSFEDESVPFPADVHDPASTGIVRGGATGLNDSGVSRGVSGSGTIASGDGTGSSLGTGSQAPSSNGSTPGGTTYGNR